MSFFASAGGGGHANPNPSFHIIINTPGTFFKVWIA